MRHNLPEGSHDPLPMKGGKVMAHIVGWLNLLLVARLLAFPQEGPLIRSILLVLALVGVFGAVMALRARTYICIGWDRYREERGLPENATWMWVLGDILLIGVIGIVALVYHIPLLSLG